MTDKVRGRASIINISEYVCSRVVSARHGSDFDYSNLKQMLQQMGFIIAKSEKELGNLAAEVSEILNDLLK